MKHVWTTPALMTLHVGLDTAFEVGSGADFDQFSVDSR